MLAAKPLGYEATAIGRKTLLGVVVSRVGMVGTFNSKQSPMSQATQSRAKMEVLANSERCLGSVFGAAPHSRSLASRAIPPKVEKVLPFSKPPVPDPGLGGH